MALGEITESLSEVVRERIRSPLSGAFIVSWVLWNWQALLFLLYDQESLTISDRVTAVSSLLTTRQSVVWPTVTAMAFIVVFPPLSMAASILWSWFDKHRKQLDLRIREIAPITPEEKRKVILAMQEQQERFDKAILMQEAELQKVRQDAHAELKQLRDTVASLQRDLSNCELQRDDCREKLGGPEPSLLDLRERDRLKRRFQSAIEGEDPGAK